MSTGSIVCETTRVSKPSRECCSAERCIWINILHHVTGPLKTPIKIVADTFSTFLSKKIRLDISLWKAMTRYYYVFNHCVIVPPRMARWDDVLTLSTLLNTFLIFPENRFCQFIQIVSQGDNLHERTKPILWENKIYRQFFVCWISPYRVVKVKTSCHHASAIMLAPSWYRSMVPSSSWHFANSILLLPPGKWCMARWP